MNSEPQYVVTKNWHTHTVPFCHFFAIYERAPAKKSHSLGGATGVTMFSNSEWPSPRPTGDLCDE